MSITQEAIIKEMKVSPVIQAQQEINERVTFMQEVLLKANKTSLVLGISGGVDSCTLGKLAQQAIDELNAVYPDKGFKFIAVRLPYAMQADNDDAQAVLDFIKPTNTVEVNIQEPVITLHNEVMFTGLLDDVTEDERDFAKGNLKARTRMAAQYHIAAMTNGLVLGTDHSAENVMGFYTKYGDGACDLAPLFGLNKRQVRALSKEMGAPDFVVTKAPTADLEDLKPAVADEVVLGLTYDQIDDYLEGKNTPEDIENKIIGIYANTMHKRDPILTIYN